MIRHTVFLAGAMLMLAPAVQAHAFLDHALPPVGGTIEVAPPEIDLFFTEAVVARFCSVAVLGRDGAVAGERLRNGNDQKELILDLPKLAPGDYTVIWHAVSVDTHRTEGRFHFTLAP